MPKAKTHQGAKKRIKVTKRGKMKRKHVRTGHLKEKESSRKKRRKSGDEDVANEFKNKLKKLIPYSG